MLSKSYLYVKCTYIIVSTQTPSTASLPWDNNTYGHTCLSPQISIIAKSLRETHWTTWVLWVLHKYAQPNQFQNGCVRETNLSLTIWMNQLALSNGCKILWHLNIKQKLIRCLYCFCFVVSQIRIGRYLRVFVANFWGQNYICPVQIAFRLSGYCANLSIYIWGEQLIQGKTPHSSTKMVNISSIGISSMDISWGITSVSRRTWGSAAVC